MKRLSVFAAVLAAALVAVAGTATAAKAPTSLDLPTGWQPEGVAFSRGFLLVGSIPTGAVLRVDPRNGRQETVVAGRPDVAAIGLKADSKDRIFVAGGPTGKAFVYAGRTGRELASFALNTTGTTFINDVALSGPFAYFTDSRSASIFRVRRDLSGFTEIPTNIPLETGTNLNGIVASRDGRFLLAIQTITGALWRIDPRTGAARQVDLGGVPLTNGDGLLLERNRLFVVQNRLNQVAVVQLSPRLESGTITRTITSDLFDVPTTVARKGDDLFLPNARFGIDAPETAAFSVTRVSTR